MRFNLLALHDPNEDKNVRCLLRVYSVVPRFSKIKTGPKAEQAIRVVQFLREVNERLKKERCITWKVKWIKSTGYSFCRTAYRDWFIGRASIPLIALKQLKIFGLKEEVKALIDSCDFFSSTTRRPFKMPHKVNPNLAYLLGAILGDGHIRKDGDKIYFEVSEEWLAKKFIEKVENVFEHKLSLGSRNDRGKPRCVVNFDNKLALRLFTEIFGIPRGKKRHKIVVPEIIKKCSPDIKIAFLEGVFDTDGGNRSRGYFGLTSASKQFRDDVAELIETLNIKVYKDEWVNKLYNRSYYGLKINKKNNIPFIAGVPEPGQSGYP